MTFDINRLTNCRLLIVGDVMLDNYLWGEVRRISPEAPVPVVHIMKKSETLGGAGNVAANIANLGAKATVIGVRGEDEAGIHLDNIFKEAGIKSHLIVDTSRQTITKTRVMSQSQQLLRLDEETQSTLALEAQTELIRYLEMYLPESHGVILSDYGKGIFQTPELCQRIIEQCRQLQVPVLVDPKGRNWERYRGATCVTPNTAELAEVTTSDIRRNEKKLVSSAKQICNHCHFDWLLVTRGANGMCLVDNNTTESLIPAAAWEVYDVSGAGDTVIATISVALACGATFLEATEIANKAAGIVVGKLGTQPITLEELKSMLQLPGKNAINRQSEKLVPLSTASMQIQAWRSSGEKIVFTNGCFDLLHPGHIDLLHQARNLGNRLVLGLNTDTSVRKLKGPTRPIISEQDRAALLGSLVYVDLLVLFDEDTPLSIIQALKPDVLVKGGDYQLKDVVGRETVESHGGRVHLIPLLEDYSTTNILNRIKEMNPKIRKQ